MTVQTESTTKFPSEVDSEFFVRPVMEPVTSRAESDTDLPSNEHSDFFGRPVTDAVTAQAGSYTDFEENSSVNSGTDGGNSDIGILADFSDYEVDPRYTPEMLEESRRINEMGFRSDEDEYTPQWEHAFQQTIAAYVDISDIDFPNGEHSELVDRRVTESVTAQTESNTNFPSGEDSEFFDRPVMESVTARAAETEQISVMNVSMVTTEQSELSDTDVPSGEDSEFIDQPVTSW